MRGQLALFHLLILYISSSFGVTRRQPTALGSQPANAPCSIMRCNTRAFVLARQIPSIVRQEFKKVSRSSSRLLCSTVRIEGDGATHVGALCHSNPKIQVLLERYKRLSEKVPDLTPTGARIEETGGTSGGRSGSHAVFSNSLVDLSRIEVVGFDYDYTLATCEVTLL